MTSNWVKRAIANNLAPHARGAVRADLRPADFGGSDDYADFVGDPPEFDRTVGDEDRDWYVALPEPENGGCYVDHRFAVPPWHVCSPTYNPRSEAPADYVGDLPHPATHPEWLDEGGSE